MVEEFEALGANFKERGAVADEQLAILSRLWGDEKPRFEGRYYRFRDVGFSPKPLQQPRIPLSGSAARGRAPSSAPRATATPGFRTL
jgi:alkanesulfonate monooxygenase SsuD/methylene tetrahydromethanopterin reductase-like flavin-dependent oxidoreductase (luciferase family)